MTSKRILTLLSVAILASCSKPSLGKFDKINSLFAKEYDYISFSSNVFYNNSDKLCSLYEIKKKDNRFIVDYHIEEFSQLDLTAISIDDSLMKVKEGRLEYYEGTFNVVEGDALDSFSIETITFNQYMLSESMFESYSFLPNGFTGICSQVGWEKIIGRPINNGEISITYSETSIEMVKFDFSDNRLSFKLVFNTKE